MRLQISKQFKKRILKYKLSCKKAEGKRIVGKEALSEWQHQGISYRKTCHSKSGWYGKELDPAEKNYRTLPKTQ